MYPYRHAAQCVPQFRILSRQPLHFGEQSRRSVADGNDEFSVILGFSCLDRYPVVAIIVATNVGLGFTAAKMLTSLTSFVPLFPP